MDPILYEYIEAMLEAREEDFEKIEAANGSYDAILSYIRGLGKDLQAFSRVFQVQNGYFTGFALGARIRQKEHIKLSVFFMDRTLFGVKGKVNAQATRVRVDPTNPTRAAIKSYKITIYFDAPPEARVTPRAYNKWLATNLEVLLGDPGIRSSYVHEFTHVMDFKRMDPKFLLQRGQQKQAEKERQKQTGEKSRDFGAYANDPLELNAYFSQAMSDVTMQLKNAKTPEERKTILGSSPQEFADKFMGVYLKKQVRKHIDPENTKRLMKRASTAWSILQKYFG